MDFHLLRLNKGEHVGEYGGVHCEACRVRRVRHHAEHVLQDVRVVPVKFGRDETARNMFENILRLVETLRGLRVRGDVLEQLEED